MHSDEYLTINDIAKLWGVPYATAKWRIRKYGGNPKHDGGRLYYTMAQVEQSAELFTPRSGHRQLSNARQVERRLDYDGLVVWTMGRTQGAPALISNRHEKNGIEYASAKLLTTGERCDVERPAHYVYTWDRVLT